MHIYQPTQPFSCSQFTVCATCNVISYDKSFALIITVVITVIARIICSLKEMLSLTGNIRVPTNGEKGQRKEEDEVVLYRTSSLSCRPSDI